MLVIGNVDDQSRIPNDLSALEDKHSLYNEFQKLIENPFQLNTPSNNQTRISNTDLAALIFQLLVAIQSVRNLT